MDFDIREFGKRMLESQLLDPSAWELLLAKFESEFSDENLNAENLAHWLCEQKSISLFQSQILLTEPEPRLQYGNYQLLDEIDAEQGVYRARHILTGHPVKLSFVAGSGSTALKRWQTRQWICQELATNRNPNVCEHYESVAINEYRFSVSELPVGKNLQQLVPLKSRIPTEKAHQIALQVALGLKHLHQRGIQPPNDLESYTWMSKNGWVKIECPPSSTSRTSTSQDQIPSARQLAKLWYRIATGRLPKPEVSSQKMPEVELVRLKKYEFDTLLINAINQAYHAKSTSEEALDEVINALEKQGVAAPIPRQPPLPQVAYQDWLQVTPVIESQIIEPVETLPARFESESPEPLEAVDPLDLASPTVEAQPSRSKFSVLAPLVGSLLLLGTILGAVVVLTNDVPNSTIATRNQTHPTSVKDVDKDSNELVRSSDETTEPPLPAPPAYVRQILIDDDKTALWESPTSDQPLSFVTVPSAPKIAIAIRLKELLDSDEGTRVLQSLGSRIGTNLNQLAERTQVALNDIQLLLITFHPNDNFEYDPFFTVQLNSPVATATLVSQWGGKSKTFEDFDYLFVNEDQCFGVANSDASTEQFVFGPEHLVRESVSYATVDTTSGIMSRLVSMSDRSRHITVLALRSGVFNDEGQKLMGAALLEFNQQLSRVISRFVRGIQLSLHIDDGSYVEIKLDQSADLTPALLKTNLDTMLANTRSQIATYSQNMSSNPYWDKVRERIAQMTDDVFTNFRVGIEDRNVIGNGWFPSSAAHNWVTAAQLLLTYGPSQFVSPDAERKTAKATPQSLQELLSTPRDLTVSTSPDLIILMNNLQQEILDDYGGLPFDFEIRLMGADLSKEGITQNQRPSDLNMQQQPLADILTEIMVKANPDKNISGPDDVACKMVWVVGPTPEEPDRKIILITTRKAAEENSYVLPPAFVPKN